MKFQRYSGKPKKPKHFLIRRVVGKSMLPTFRHGQLIIGKCNYLELYPEDVVIITHDGLEKVKRISRSNKDSVYLLGDNSDISSDSRTFGWVPKQAVIAKVIWPKTKLRFE